MSKEKFNRNKPHCNIGTIGHVDHGKTTLTAAITKDLSEAGGSSSANFVAYDQIEASSEEKKKITISTGSRWIWNWKRHYAHVDCPGHADYVKNMIWERSNGWSDFSCKRCWRTNTQTREHILLARQVGVPAIVVFLNKIDTVKDKSIDLVEEEIRELLTSYKFPGDKIPIIKGSALNAVEGKDEPKAKTQLWN